MSSQALENYNDRTNEVEQLLEAHGALVRFRRAEEALSSMGQELSKISAVVEALVAQPGPGRPPEVQALNSAAVALLSGHLQGFIADIFEETARALVGHHVQNIEELIESAPTRGNPNERNITRLFASIGFAKILDGISWSRMSNDSLKKNLKEFNELRNRIVHGTRETVTKSRVQRYARIWKSFATQLDSKLKRAIRRTTGANPW